MRSTSTQNTPKARRRAISASSSDSGYKYYSIQGSLTSKSKCYSSSNISESSSGEDHNSNYPDATSDLCGIGIPGRKKFTFIIPGHTWMKLVNGINIVTRKHDKRGFHRDSEWQDPFLEGLSSGGNIGCTMCNEYHNICTAIPSKRNKKERNFLTAVFYCSRDGCTLRVKCEVKDSACIQSGQDVTVICTTTGNQHHDPKKFGRCDLKRGKRRSMINFLKSCKGTVTKVKSLLPSNFSAKTKASLIAGDYTEFPSSSVLRRLAHTIGIENRCDPDPTKELEQLRQRYKTEFEGTIRDVYSLKSAIEEGVQLIVADLGIEDITEVEEAGVLFNEVPSEYLAPQFIESLTSYIPFAHLWSGLTSNASRYSRDGNKEHVLKKGSRNFEPPHHTNGLIESWFSIVKVRLLGNNLHRRPGDVIQVMADHVKGKTVELSVLRAMGQTTKFSDCTKKYKKSKKRYRDPSLDADDLLTMESWNKTRKTGNVKRGVYMIPTSDPLPPPMKTKKIQVKQMVNAQSSSTQCDTNVPGVVHSVKSLSQPVCPTKAQPKQKLQPSTATKKCQKYDPMKHHLLQKARLKQVQSNATASAMPVESLNSQDLVTVLWASTNVALYAGPSNGKSEQLINVKDVCTNKMKQDHVPLQCTPDRQEIVPNMRSTEIINDCGTDTKEIFNRNSGTNMEIMNDPEVEDLYNNADLGDILEEMLGPTAELDARIVTMAQDLIEDYCKTLSKDTHGFNDIHDYFSLDATPRNSDFIQILCIVDSGFNHFVVLSSKFLDEDDKGNTAVVYDSLVTLSKQKHHLNKKAIPTCHTVVADASAMLLHCTDEDTIAVVYMPVQRQSTGENGWANACGAYAILNAAALAMDIDPAKISIPNELLLRRGIYLALKNNDLNYIKECIVDKLSVVHWAPVDVFIESIYCTCRRTHRKAGDRQYMISCDQCESWYHCVCIDMHVNNAKSEADGKWYVCPNCIALERFSEPLVRCLPKALAEAEDVAAYKSVASSETCASNAAVHLYFALLKDCSKGISVIHFSGEDSVDVDDLAQCMERLRDFKEIKKILAPVNNKGHFYLMAADVRQRTVHFFDSDIALMGLDNELKNAKTPVQLVPNCAPLIQFHEVLKKAFRGQWSFQRTRIPQQSYAKDSGIFVMLAAKAFSADMFPFITQEMIKYYRQVITVELCQKQLYSKGDMDFSDSCDTPNFDRVSKEHLSLPGTQCSVCTSVTGGYMIECNICESDYHCTCIAIPTQNASTKNNTRWFHCAECIQNDKYPGEIEYHMDKAQRFCNDNQFYNSIWNTETCVANHALVGYCELVQRCTHGVKLFGGHCSIYDAIDPSINCNYSAELYENQVHRTVRATNKYMQTKEVVKIIAPVIKSGHYFFMGADIEKKEVVFYDSFISLRDSNENHRIFNEDYTCDNENDLVPSCVELNFFSDCLRRLFGDKWTFIRHKIPQQQNGTDCGIFTMLAVKCFITGMRPFINQDSINYYRKCLIGEMVGQTLFPSIIVVTEMSKRPNTFADVRNTEVAGAFDIDKAISSYLHSNSSVASRQVHGEAIALQKLRISAERQQIAAQNMCNEWVANLQAHQINQDNQKSHQDYIMELHNASVQAQAIGNENYVASMTLFNKEQNERQLGLYHPSILVPSPNWEFGKQKMESHSRSDSTSTSSSEKLDNELAARVADLTLDRLQRLPHPPNCQH